MSKTITIDGGITVEINDFYTPNIRNQVRSIALSASTTDVDAEYRGVEVFIKKVSVVENNAETQIQETVQKAPEWLRDNVRVADYQEIVKAVLEVVQSDKGIHRLIGAAFGLVELSEDEEQKIIEAQKKGA